MSNNNKLILGLDLVFLSDLIFLSFTVLEFNAISIKFGNWTVLGFVLEILHELSATLLSGKLMACCSSYYLWLF